MKNDRLQQLFEIFETNEQDSFIVYAIAHEYQKMEDWDMAMEWYKKLYSIAPDYLGMYLQWSRVAVQLNQNEKAIELLEEGIRWAIEKKDLKTKGELETELNLMD
jgi:tetratricopeptide (TPR) repeat protein